MLTTRLRSLVADGVLERRPYQTNPIRHEYVTPGRLRPGSVFRWTTEGLDITSTVQPPAGNARVR